MSFFDRLFKFKDQELPSAAPKGLDSEVAVSRMLAQLGAETDEILSKAQEERTKLKLVALDDEVSQALETRKEAVIATDWRLEPGDGPVTEFVHDQLKPRIESIIRTAFSAIPFGYSVAELIWRDDEGKTVLDDVAMKPFEWFKITNDGRPIWVDMGIERDLYALYPGKFVLTRREPSYEHPAGRPLLSLLYWPWFFKSQGVELWAIALERYGQPLLVGKKQRVINDASLAKFADELRKAARGGVLALDKNDEVTSIGGANWKGPHDEYIRYFDRQFQKVILGQNLTSDVSGGSFAAAQTHNLVRIDKRNADLRLITGTIQEIIRIMCWLNFPGQEPPEFVFDDGVGLQADRSTRDKDLAPVLEASGFQYTREYFQDQYGLEPEYFTEKASGGDAESNLSSPAASSLAPNELADFVAGLPMEEQALFWKDGRLLFKDGKPEQFKPKQQAIENLVDNAITSSPPPLPRGAVLAAIDKSKSPLELRDNLIALLGDDVNLQEFRTHFENALYMAEMWGYGSSQEEHK